jgi:predicted PurR-regulated permease PerM
MGHTLFVRIMIVVAFGLLFWLFFPFLSSFFVALLLVIAFTPIHSAFEAKLKKYPKLISYAPLLTASVMTLILITLLFVPIIFFAYYVIANPNEIIQIGETFYQQGIHVLSLIPNLPDWLEKPIAMLNEKVVQNQEKIVSSAAMSLGNGLIGVINTIGNMVLILAFFFFISWYRRDITLAITPIIPIKRHIRQEFIMDMISTTSVGFYSLIGLAIAQGLAFGIFISFFDGYNPWLLGLMVAVTSVIPIVGTALVWIPIALNEYFSGNSTNALIIFFYSWAMLSFFIDNVVRLIILQQLNRLLSQGREPINDFLVFFAIMAGLVTFGFWGFILGPAIMAFVVTLLRMLRRNHLVR